MQTMVNLIPMLKDAHISAWMARRNSTASEAAVSLKAAGKVGALEAALESLSNVASDNPDDTVAREKFTRIVENEKALNQELSQSEPYELDRAIYAGAVEGFAVVQELLKK